MAIVGLCAEMNSTQDIDPLLDLLSANSAGNAMNGMIEALGLLFREHIEGQDTSDQMRAAFSTFASSVIETVDEGPVRRKHWPEREPLPKFDNKPQILRYISEQIRGAMDGLEFDDGLVFLGDLWGRWLLTCPKELLVDLLDSSSSSSAEISEDDLLRHLVRYLDIYGSMPTPTSIPAA